MAIDQTFALNKPDAQYQFVELILNAYTLIDRCKIERDLGLKHHLNASLV